MMKTLAISGLVLLHVASCGGGGSQGGGQRDIWARAPGNPTCGTVGEMTEARLEESMKVMALPAGIDTRVADAMIERCKTDDWSPDAVACFSSPSFDPGTCYRTRLPPEQQATYLASLKELRCNQEMFCR